MILLKVSLLWLLLSSSCDESRTMAEAAASVKGAVKASSSGSSGSRSSLPSSLVAARRQLQGAFKGQPGYSPNGTPLELVYPRCPDQTGVPLPQSPNILMFEVHRINGGVCEANIVGGTTLLQFQAQGYACGTCPTGMVPVYPEVAPTNAVSQVEVPERTAPVTSTTTPAASNSHGNSNFAPMTTTCHEIYIVTANL